MLTRYQDSYEGETQEEKVETVFQRWQLRELHPIAEYLEGKTENYMTSYVNDSKARAASRYRNHCQLERAREPNRLPGADRQEHRRSCASSARIQAFWR